MKIIARRLAVSSCLLVLGCAADGPGMGGPWDDTPPSACRAATAPCTTGAQCCGSLNCDTTTLGQVCCGGAGASCTTENGEDCCGDLLCVGGHCVTATSCLDARAACTATADCCGNLSCAHTTLGQVCCGDEGETCHTANGEDCCGDLECVSGHCVRPGGAVCRAAAAACTAPEQCCDGRSCAHTTLGQVCCGQTGAACTRADGADCCGDLLCESGHCVAAASASCTAPAAACTGSGECCGGRTCGSTTLGRVCCGETGAACSRADGADCCGALECVSGHCGGASSSGTSGDPTLDYFPVRARHDVGYLDDSTGDASLWTCDDAHSNSDFIPVRHLGNDIWAAEGATVIATVSGQLRYVRNDSYSGNTLTIVDSRGWYHFYCHLSGFGPGVSSGTTAHVSAGQIVGYVGHTGTASGGTTHLHYSIYPDDNYNAGINPYPYLHAVEHAVCSIP